MSTIRGSTHVHIYNHVCMGDSMCLVLQCAIKVSSSKSLSKCIHNYIVCVHAAYMWQSQVVNDPTVSALSISHISRMLY